MNMWAAANPPSPCKEDPNLGQLYLTAYIVMILHPAVAYITENVKLS